MTHLVYVTVKDMAEAKAIAGGLLEKRLIACANIVDSIYSIYRWKGEVCESNEVLLLAKTSEDKVSEVVEEVRKRHSYDLPAIVAFPLTAGLPEFFNWVGAEVGSS